MTEPTRQPTPDEARDHVAASSRRVLHGAAQLAIGLSLSAVVAGCSAIEAGVPLEETSAATPTVDTDPSLPPGASEAAADHPTDPADQMFQTTEPFARTASDVNVFGELDGLAPNPFDGGGAAGFRQVTVVEEGYDADQTVSPDGKWLLFSSTRHSERPDIYVQRVGGQAITQLTSDPADDSFPRFSPDGTQIVFASNRSGNWDVYLMDVEGKNVRQLTHSPAQEIHPSFSPDGTRIVYSVLGSRSGQWELWTLNLQTSERRMIGYGLFPDWSPRTDKDVIAFQRARQRGTRWFSVWTLELADGEARDLTEIAYSSSAAIVAPTWSPDGKRIAFGSIADPIAAEDSHGHAHEHSATQDIWTANADGTDRRKLTDGRGVNASPAWGVDGRIYFVSNRGGSESIWSTPAGFPAGDAHARRARLPDSDGVDDARTASKRVDVPLPSERAEPTRTSAPLITSQPPPVAEGSSPNAGEPKALPNQPAKVIVDEPIVLKPVDGGERQGEHDDPESDTTPANQPSRARDEASATAGEPANGEH